MSGQIPAGWYHDPYGTSGLRRYWDGTQWTQATQPADEWDDTDAGGSPAPSFTPPDSAPPAQGGTTPPPWSPPSAPGGGGAQPNWAQPQPSPWEAPKGPVTPQPWTAPPAAAPRSGNTGLLWALGGGGAFLLLLIVAVVLVATGAFDSDSPTRPSPSPTPTAAAPSVNPSGRSPVVGTVTDTAGGVSYAQLGGAWRPQDLPSDSALVQAYGFTRGLIATVQEDYNGQSGDYVASIYSGRLPESFSYDGEDDLKSATEEYSRRIESEPEPNGVFPTHTREDLESKELTVGDRPAYSVKFRLSFPQAQANGWNFRTETALFVLIDQGSGERPSLVFITIPDSHPNGGDLDQLFQSIKVL